MSAVRSLGSLLIAMAIISLLFFIGLEKDDTYDDFSDSYQLDGQSDKEYNFSADEDTEFDFTYDSTIPINVVLKNNEDGSETIIEEDNTHTDYHHYFEQSGDYTIRFENKRSESAEVQFSRSFATEGDEGPRPLCGVFTVIFFILGIIMRSRKQKQGPIVIQARHMPKLAPTPTIPPQQAPSPFAPPSQQPQPTFPAPNQHPPTPPSIPMPMASSSDNFRFDCPDCKTIIFINSKIKKVTCPKCSHTFRIKR